MVFFYLIPIRKKTAYNNLTLCFPEKDNKWKKNILRKCYSNIIITLFELLYFPKMKRELLDSFISFNNLHLVEEALEKGKGVFFISGHISNWELLAFSYAKVFNTKLNIIAKPQSNKLINKKVTQYRERCGNKIIETGAPLKAIFEKISMNEIICFLDDQSANPIYSVYSEFFGQKVATFSGPFKIALKYNTEVLFGYIVRSPDFKYVINIDKIEFGDLNGSNDEKLQLLTDRINKNYERVIRANPDQWLWFHRRFKHIKNN